MIEDGTGQNESVSESHRDADGKSFANISQHAAGSGAVEIDRVADARVERGNHEGLAIDRKTDVADESFIENLVDGRTVVDAAMRFAHDARALGRRGDFLHDSPH